MSLDDWPGSSAQGGLLIDANLVVLLVVGRVNPKRIRSFKRTRAYDFEAYDLLLRGSDEEVHVASIQASRAD